MTLFGLIDWIVISLIGLAICFVVVCLMLMLLYDLFSFKPPISYRPSTRFEDKEGNVHIVEAPNLFNRYCYERGLKTKWYIRFIVDP
ncbi:hypothetical protein GCM10028806_28400 [Spirosoma terrae]|uniref:Uncharacterized protein n=1 Tax=Spirosoma terrae TaxID=1968276 RepID=A0A6L9L9S0_9BACT|nr:hypothetical protein [Spirosoma terrae]NDU97200.1 hypothetical protein [Spirosoma terrae]